MHRRDALMLSVQGTKCPGSNPSLWKSDTASLSSSQLLLLLLVLCPGWGSPGENCSSFPIFARYFCECSFSGKVLVFLCVLTGSEDATI